jgi:hypothetical protein
MKHGFFSLRRLRWKLTFSYTLVTVIALLVVELFDVVAVITFLKSESHSNAEISSRPFIGEKTTMSHVSNILSKLHLADRTQATVYAWRQGVVRRS